MTDSRTDRADGRVCVLIVFTILLAAFPAIIFDFYYDLNDDTLIKDIVSGAYTGSPSGYSVQLLYPLSWAISLLYRAVPDLAWYGLFLCFCQFGAAILIAVRLTCIFKTVKGRILSLLSELFILYGLFLRELVIVQYSVTAGICMAAAIFLFLTSDCIGSVSGIQVKKNNTIPVLLVVLAFMIRTEVCIMLMPFVLAAGVLKWSREDRIFTAAAFRKYLFTIAGALLGMVVMLSIDTLAYHENDWSGFRDFFDARTQLYDFYDIPDYESNKEFYDSIGLSEESYKLLENYNFGLDESIDTWLLETIADYQKQKLPHTFGFVSKKNIREAAWGYCNRFLHNMSINDLVVAAAYILYLTSAALPLAGKRKPFWKILTEAVLLMLIRSALWLYLYMVDRVLDRVTVPIVMAELACIAGLLVNDAVCTDDEAGSKIRRLAVCIGMMLLTTAAFWNNFCNVRDEFSAREAADGRWNAFLDYCRQNGDGYYLIDVYSSVSYEGAPYSEKLFCNVDNSYKNFDYCGGWIAKSPVSRYKLEKRGFHDMQGALLKGNGVYFVAAPDRDMEWLVKYYARRGINAECICADEICTDSGDTAFLVYSVRRKE